LQAKNVLIMALYKSTKFRSSRSYKLKFMLQFDSISSRATGNSGMVIPWIHATLNSGWEFPGFSEFP